MSVFVAHFQTQVYLTGQTVFLSPPLLPKLLSCLPHTQSLLARPFTSPGVCAPMCMAFHFQHHLYVCVRLLFSWFSCYFCSFLFFFIPLQSQLCSAWLLGLFLGLCFLLCQGLGVVSYWEGFWSLNFDWLLLFLSTDLESSRYPRECLPSGDTFFFFIFTVYSLGLPCFHFCPEAACSSPSFPTKHPTERPQTHRTKGSWLRRLQPPGPFSPSCQLWSPSLPVWGPGRSSLSSQGTLSEAIRT